MNLVKRWLPLLVCLLHLSFLWGAARQHPFGTYSTETDFYHYYAPDAERLIHGQFPANTFQGPGYPATLTVIAKLTGKSADLFTVGKWLSVICAVLCGWLIFQLFAQLFGFWTGITAQAFAVVSGEFLQFSISATTDVFFLLLCLATLVAITRDSWRPLTRTLLAGALAGAAYVTRYNGVFLLLAVLYAILLLDQFVISWQERLRHCIILLGLFFLTASPWLIANGRHHGSAFYNTNYLNLATEFFPELVKGEVNQDATRKLAERFHSFGDVVRYDPARFFKRYPLNFWESLRNTVKEGLLNHWLAWTALVGLILIWWDKRIRVAGVLMTAAMFYQLLMALNHWETRYYFFVMTLAAGFAAYAVIQLFTLARQHGWLMQPAFLILPVGLLLALWGTAFVQGRKGLRQFLDNHPYEMMAARNYLASVGQCSPANGKRVVARKPHLPYFCHNEWMFFPQVESLDELRVWLQQNSVDYVVISQRELKERKKLRSLGDTAKAPAWLKPVWSNQEPLVVLYQPNAP